MALALCFCATAYLISNLVSQVQGQELQQRSDGTWVDRATGAAIAASADADTATPAAPEGGAPPSSDAPQVDAREADSDASATAAERNGSVADAAEAPETTAMGTAELARTLDAGTDTESSAEGSGVGTAEAASNSGAREDLVTLDPDVLAAYRSARLEPAHAALYAAWPAAAPDHLCTLGGVVHAAGKWHRYMEDEVAPENRGTVQALEGGGTWVGTGDGASLSTARRNAHIDRVPFVGDAFHEDAIRAETPEQVTKFAALVAALHDGMQSGDGFEAAVHRALPDFDFAALSTEFGLGWADAPAASSSSSSDSINADASATSVPQGAKDDAQSSNEAAIAADGSGREAHAEAGSGDGRGSAAGTAQVSAAHNNAQAAGAHHHFDGICFSTCLHFYSMFSGKGQRICSRHI